MSALPSPHAADPAEVETGFALLTGDELGARRAFVRGHAAAEHAGDAVAQWLCAAGMLLAIAIEHADFRGLEPWLARFRAGFDRAPAVGRRRQRARLSAAAVVLPTLTEPRASEAAVLDQHAARVMRTLIGDDTLAADERVLLAKVLVEHHGRRNDALGVNRVAACVQEHLHNASVSPRWQAHWWLLMRAQQASFGNPSAAQAAQARAQALIDSHKLPGLRFELACLEMDDALKQGDLAQAERLNRELDDLRPDVRAGRLPHGLRAQAALLVRRGQYREAVAKLDLLLALCADVELPLRARAVYVVLRAHCRIALEQHAALADLDTLRATPPGGHGEVLNATLLMLTAVVAMQTGAPDMPAQVALAVRACAAIGHDQFLLHLPAWAGRVAEVALDHGTESDFVRAAIRQRRLLPSQPTREDWPWRVKVCALGELRLLRDGEPVPTTGKALRKPVELLALLAAHGGGPLAAEAVIGALWPSLDAGAARTSFDAALSRLRTLVDVADAVRAIDGTVALNPSLVWTDVAAFEHACERAAGGGPLAAERAEQALVLYRDRLLGGEETGGLSQAARERLAQQFARLVEDRGAAFEQQGQWRAAMRLYERALVRDPLAEPIYRALMRAHLELGERAEALRTHRRCCQMLRAVLGSEPSAQTQALARSAAEAG